MTDIVERLRQWGVHEDQVHLKDDAADEIEWLRAERDRYLSCCERLRSALKFFADPENWKLNGKLDPNGPRFIGRIHARAALGGNRD